MVFKHIALFARCYLAKTSSPDHISPMPTAAEPDEAVASTQASSHPPETSSHDAQTGQQHATRSVFFDPGSVIVTTASSPQDACSVSSMISHDEVKHYDILNDKPDHVYSPNRCNSFEPDASTCVKAESPNDSITASPTALRGDIDQTETATSLMDLPPELRLQIYEYLFAGEPAQLKYYHCCGDSLAVHSNGVRRQPAKCDCKSGRLQPQILAVCEIIFKEAMPLLYADLELRVVVPKPCHQLRRKDIISNLIPDLPAYAAKHIKKIALVGFCGDMRHTPYKPDADRDELKDFWPAVWSTYDNVEEIRLHFDNFNVKATEQFDYESFKGIIQFPKLRKILIQLHTPYTHFDYAMRFAHASGMLSAYLRAEAQLVRRTVEVATFLA